MYDDKCPTCPNYGKGYCDCGKSKFKKENAVAYLLGVLVFIIILLKLYI